MKFTCWLAFASSLLLFSGCASNSGIVPVGNDTFMVTRQAATGFSGSGNLKAEAMREASAFCASQGKVMKVVAVTEAQPPYLFGNFPKAEVVFKALPPNSPELKKDAVFDPHGVQIKVGEKPSDKQELKVTTSVTNEKDVYERLEKLSELKKKGVITEEEFIAEKKRLLERE